MSIIICVGNQFAFQSKRLALLGARKGKFLTLRGNFDLSYAVSNRVDWIYLLMVFILYIGCSR